MKVIPIIIADSHDLARAGLKALFNTCPDLLVAAEVVNEEGLKTALRETKEAVVVIDYLSEGFLMKHVQEATESGARVLGLTSGLTKEIAQKSIECGLVGHVLKECSAGEISDAVYATAKNEKFFCAKILNVLMQADNAVLNPVYFSSLSSTISCNPVVVSTREMEIIKLIAEGLTNKEIADRLFLSIHTVTTHRKNIMHKLGVNNTAGIVMYALQHNLAWPKDLLNTSAN